MGFCILDIERKAFDQTVNSGIVICSNMAA